MVKSTLILRRPSTKVGPEFGPLFIPWSQNFARIYSLQPPCCWTRCQISFCRSWQCISMHLNASHPVSMQSKLFQYNQQHFSSLSFLPRVFRWETKLNWRYMFMLSLLKHIHSCCWNLKKRIKITSEFFRTYLLLKHIFIKISYLVAIWRKDSEANMNFSEHTSCANLQKLRINATFHSAKVIKVF